MNNNGSKRVLILESDAELGQLMQMVLSDTGYEAEWLEQVDNVVSTVRERRPDMLVLDLRLSKDSYRTLDELRSGADTRNLPVIVTAESDDVAEGALTSPNVHGFFTKLLDLDVFLRKVNEVLHQPPAIPVEPLPATQTTDLLLLAENILARHSREAMFRWIQRLRQESPWADRKDLQLHELLANTPVLVQAMQEALPYGRPEDFFSRYPEATKRIRDRTLSRLNQGFALTDLVREYAILRDELLQVLWDNLPEQVSRDELLTITQALDAASDRVIKITISSFLEETGCRTAL
ncbi:MAG: response regulator [Chloroflexota bacterium]